jgi:cell division protein ZapB
MEISLKSLDRKLGQLIELCDNLRADNQALRSRVAGLEAERTALTAKIDATRHRLEVLADRLPAE